MAPSPPVVEAAPADRERLSSLAGNGLVFGVLAVAGLLALLGLPFTGSAAQMIVGFWLVVICGPTALTYSVKASFASSGFGLRCPMRAILAGLMGAGSLVGLVLGVVHVISTFGDTFR